MKFLHLLALCGLLLLAACGPADVEQAGEEAAASAEAALNDPAVQASAEAALNDPTVQALASDALNDPTVQALASDAAAQLEGLVPSDLSLDRDQPLVLNTTREIAGVTNYRWVIADAPAGAESVEGEVIQENSNGQLTIDPADYDQYFPTAGDYTIDLELTFTDGTTQTTQIPLVVP